MTIVPKYLFYILFINFPVIKRLENVQVNLMDVTNKEELLAVSKVLRVQQEKAKELENQASQIENL